MSSGQIICKGAGPVDGHPHLITSYHSKTTGIVAILYILHRICDQFFLTTGKVTCFCDSKDTHQSIHGLQKKGTTPFLNFDYNMVHLTHFLLDTIPVQVKSRVNITQRR